MNNFQKLVDKYNNDPEFHALVTNLMKMIEACQFTPLEIKQASTFACTYFEMNQVRTPLILKQEQENQ